VLQCSADVRMGCCAANGELAYHTSCRHQEQHGCATLPNASDGHNSYQASAQEEDAPQASGPAASAMARARQPAATCDASCGATSCSVADAGPMPPSSRHT